MLFGATGDLARRKLLRDSSTSRALRLFPVWRIIGISLDDLDVDAFRTFARAAVDEFSTRKVDESAWTEFAQTLDYMPLSAGADALKAAVPRAEESLGGESHRLHYLGRCPPKTLRSSGRAHAGQSRSRDPLADHHGKAVRHKNRITVKLAANLHEVFAEEQIFRIDHFLGKEPAQNILAFRFANYGLFRPPEPQDRNFIDHVQIDVPEKLSLDHRAAFYEQTGAFRDMVVTHLLQIVAFMAMGTRRQLELDRSAKKRTNSSRCMLAIDPEDVVRGQYTGYRHEEGDRARIGYRKRSSRSKCMIDNWRWAGVPFSLRTGKRLAEGMRIIAPIAFREPPKSMFPVGSGVGAEGPDHLTFDLADASKMSLSFYGKRPGPGMKLEKLSLQFAMQETGLIDDVLEAYERLILGHDAQRSTRSYRDRGGHRTLVGSVAPTPGSAAAGAPLSARVVGPEVDPPARRAARVAAAVLSRAWRSQNATRSLSAERDPGTSP